MIASTGASAQQLLDRVQRLAHLDEFDVDGWVAQLRDELVAMPASSLAELEARDDRLRATLPWFDALASRAMKIRLEHLAVDWPALTQQFRTLLTTTVTSYVDDLERLRARVAGSVVRQDPRGAEQVAAVVVDAAASALGLRGALGDAVLGLAVELAHASYPAVDQQARNPGLPDDVRLRWTALRRDLDLVIDGPLRFARQRFADRQRDLLATDLRLDELREPTRGELIELY